MNDLGLRLSANWTGVRCLLCLGAVLMAFGCGYWCRAMTEATEQERALHTAERLVMGQVERIMEARNDGE